MLKKLKQLFKNEYFNTSSEYSGGVFKNNRGSALILVIVTVGFVTILASIVMSSAIVNHKIRSIDRRTKDDFYYAEKALDDIYTGIGEDCAIAMGEAYSEVAAGNGHSYTFTNQEDAYKAYKTLFINKVWTKSYDKTALESYITVKPGSGHKIDVDIQPSNIQFFKKDGETAATISDDDAKILKIKSLKVTCTEEATGYISTICTDIVIDVPDAHFFTVQESPLDYAIIANKGIKFKSGVTKVNGRVYAGPIGSSVNAYDIEDNADVTLVGDYLAARGDIDLNNNSKLTLGKDGIGSRVWFENLKLSKDGATLEAGNRTGLFALGDLEINAKDCTAKLGGAYYGYNNETITSSEPDYKTKEYEALLASGRDRDNAKNAFSSSIIVNGNNATVDVSNLQTLLLMGRAYLDFSGKKKAGETDYEYATGEGFALKTNQEIYLVPQEFITNGYTNPAKESEVGTGFSFSGNCNIPDTWFGSAYLSTTNKVRTVKVNDLYYAYLGLEKPGEYFEKVAGAVYDTLETVSPTSFELKKKMEGSTANSIFSFNGLKFNSGANIYINNGTAPNGAAEFDSGFVSKSSNLGIGSFASYPEALYTKYRDLCTNLAAHENIALGTPVGNVSDSDWNNTDYPAKKFVKYDDVPTISSTVIDSAYKGDTSDDTMYKHDFELESGVYGTVSVKTGSITQGNATDGIFLFVDGDVEITAGSTVNGMIIATGTVTINGGSDSAPTEITSDNSLLQKRIDKELSNARHALANGRYESANKGNVYKSDYVISYLLDPSTGDRMYKYIAEDTYTDVVKEVTQSIPSDYKQYVTLDNWKKGE